MENSHGNWENEPRSRTIEGTAVARIVASRATSAVQSMSPINTGPRSERRPTAEGLSATVILGGNRRGGRSLPGCGHLGVRVRPVVAHQPLLGVPGRPA